MGVLHLDPAHYSGITTSYSSSQVLARVYTPGPSPDARKVKVCLKGKV